MIHVCVGSSGHGSGFGGGSGFVRVCVSLLPPVLYWGWGPHPTGPWCESDNVLCFLLLAGDDKKKKKSMDYNDRALKFRVAPDCNENPFMACTDEQFLSPQIAGRFPMWLACHLLRKGPSPVPGRLVSKSLGLSHGIHQSHTLLASPA